MNGRSRALWIALAVAPALAMLAALVAFNVDVPFWDEWIAIGPLFEKMGQGTLALSDVTAQHNEHRILFPKLVCLVLGTWGGWDVRRETYVTLLLTILTAWNVKRLLERTVESSGARIGKLFFLMSLLVFSPAQWKNWFSGMQLALLVPPLCLTTALLVLSSERKPWVRVGVAMLLSTIATFSVGNGGLCWIVLLPPLLASSPSRARILAAWIAGVGVNVAMYLVGFNRPPIRSPLDVVLETPLRALHYFASFLGGTFAPTFGSASELASVLFGATTLALFVGVCVLRTRRGGSELARSLPWMSLGVYSILTAAMTTFARVDIGDWQSLSSRYVSFSLYLAASLVPLIGLRPGNAIAERAAAAILAVAAIAVWPESLRSILDMRRIRLEGKACVQFAGVLEDVPGLRLLNPRLPDLREHVLALDRGGFLSPPLLRSARAQEIAGDASVDCGVFAHLERRGNVYAAEGTAVLPGRSEPADAILLAHDGPDGSSTIFAVSVAAFTPDNEVAQRETRWRTTFAASKLPADTVSVSAWAFDTLSRKAYRLRGAPASR